MRLKGKISKWFYGIMIFVAVILIPIIILAIKDKKMLVVVVVLGIFALIETFCFPIVLHNYVELNDDSLLIAFGFIKVRILYRDIEKISATKDPSSSLAASLDRIKIQTNNGKILMISLYNKQEFYKEIKKKKADIRII